MRLERLHKELGYSKAWQRSSGEDGLDIEQHNRIAWNRRVEQGDRWTLTVSADQVAEARRGVWSVVLTPTKPVPREWFGQIEGSQVLCLASGGGQQAPLFAAVGACVTLLDNSPDQLAQDRGVADREFLDIRLELGSMIDLSRFPDESFDLVFHPVSNVFVPDVRPVWREAHRVLKPGGQLLSGFCNPLTYLFDWEEADERGDFVVRYSLPYSDVESQSAEAVQRRIDSGEPLEFGHTLEDQIGGQLDAGFVITGFFEDADPESPLTRFAPTFIATRSVKLSPPRP